MLQRYGWRWVSRAAHDAAAFLGIGGALVTAIVGACVAYVAASNFWPGFVSSVIPGAVVTLFGLLAAFGVVFLAFLVVAPARMERDERAAHDTALTTSAAQIVALTAERDRLAGTRLHRERLNSLLARGNQIRSEAWTTLSKPGLTPADEIVQLVERGAQSWLTGVIDYLESSEPGSSALFMDESWSGVQFRMDTFEMRSNVTNYLDRRLAKLREFSLRRPG